MNKITIEFDDITKTKKQQFVKTHCNMNTNVISIAAAINELIENLDNKTDHMLLDAMICLCKTDKEILCKRYEEDDNLLFEGDPE